MIVMGGSGRLVAVSGAGGQFDALQEAVEVGRGMNFECDGWRSGARCCPLGGFLVTSGFGSLFKMCVTAILTVHSIPYRALGLVGRKGCKRGPHHWVCRRANGPFRLPLGNSSLTLADQSVQISTRTSHSVSAG